MDYGETSWPYRYREWGNSLAALANRLGISPALFGYAVQRGEAVAHENGYQLIQCDIDFFKDVPQYIPVLKRCCISLEPFQFPPIRKIIKIQSQG